MNKLKLTMAYRWAGGVWNEWLNRAKPQGALQNPLHKEIKNAAGDIRILIAPLGADPASRIRGFLLRKTIRNGLGPAAKIVAAREPFVWDSDVSFEVIMKRHAQAQQILKNNNGDVLIVRQPAPGKAPLLHLFAESKRPFSYLQAEKFELPVRFGRDARAVFSARLFIAASQAIQMGRLRLPPLHKLVARAAQKDGSKHGPSGWTLANIGFLHRLLGEQPGGSNDDLKKAVAGYIQALAEIRREREPLAWARVQDDLGGVLRMLGERQNDTALLQQSAEAFRAALTERTRERVPLQWAMTQGNLGTVLAAIEVRKQDGQLQEAIAAFQLALTEWTREQVPLDWARIQHELGRVLFRAGEQRKDEALVVQAIDAFRAALQETPFEKTPDRWGVTQLHLGNAFLRLAEHRKGMTGQRDAVEAFRAALMSINRHTAAQQWSTTHHKIGSALTAIGAREKDKACLQQAIAAYREALKVRTRKRMPQLWATTQNDLGAALLKLAELDNNPAHLKDGIAALQSAASERTQEQNLTPWAASQNKLGDAFLRLADFEDRPANLQQAIGAYRSALTGYQKGNAPNAAKAVEVNLAAAEQRLKAASVG